MITKEDADNLESENLKELVDIICTQSELIDDLYSQLKQRDDEIERLKKELLYYQEKATTNKIIEDCFLDL